MIGINSFESTPNPNAIKCVVDRPTGQRIRSYFNADQAADDPLGSALFAIPGVTNAMIQPAFITVCKAPDAGWPAIKKAVRAVLKDAEPETPDAP